MLQQALKVRKKAESRIEKRPLVFL